jgi:hypothetical protein
VPCKRGCRGKRASTILAFEPILKGFSADKTTGIVYVIGFRADVAIRRERYMRFTHLMLAIGCGYFILTVAQLAFR